MTTYKVGRISTDQWDTPLISTGLSVAGTNVAELIAINGLTFDNLKNMKAEDMPKYGWEPCLYDPAATYLLPDDADFSVPPNVSHLPNASDFMVPMYPRYDGKLYFLPLSKEDFGDDTIADGEAAALLNVFIFTKAINDNFWTGDFYGRKFQYYVSLDMRLTLVQGMIVKACDGLGTFEDRICSQKFDEIPVPKVYARDMEKYQIPWYRKDNPGKIIGGRAMDWNKTFRENGFVEGESVNCFLLRAGNRLTSYPGSAQTDWKALGIDALLDVVIGVAGSKV